MSARGSPWLLRWGFVGPTLLLLIAFNVFPLGFNIVLSFLRADFISIDGSVGGANYARVFSSPHYALALRTTAAFVFAAVSIELLLGFCLALALQRGFRGKTAVLTLLLVPMMLSPAVMGLLWNLILQGNYGILNQLLRGCGLGEPQWLTDPKLKLLSVIIVDVWMWTPFMMLIALAGLNSIPGYIYEAAEIDRASRLTVFRRITLPLCAPFLLLAVLFRVTDAAKQFDLVYAMTGPNDPSTQTTSALLYETMVNQRALGPGSAYACVVLVVVIALATVFTRFLERMQTRSAPGATA